MRSYGVVLATSVVVGCLEVALAVVVASLYVRTQPSTSGTVDFTGLLPLVTLTAVLAFVFSLVFVVPAVWVGDVVERRGGGRWGWWAPVVVAALVAVPVGAFGAYNDVSRGPLLLFWGGATAALSLGAVLAGIRAGRLIRRVAGWGAAVVVGTGLIGALGFGTGLWGYEPPRIGPGTMPGAWVDHRGGSLTFTADGRVNASDVGMHLPFDEPSGPSRQCTGTGTWSYERGPGGRAQEVRVSVPGCSWPAWRVSGTARTPWIYQSVGQPGSGKVYELRKAGTG
ncbi:hypothetical protein [Streptomyces sp. NPDC089919]|uniref:hypothetical protein n=1 Tax=Streptomyces sp. NPDC089919 TaxID=3155188 RepID=UPI0034390437